MIMQDTDMLIEVAKLDYPDHLEWYLRMDGIVVNDDLCQNAKDYLTSHDALIPVIKKLCNNDSDFAKDFICALYSEHTHPECDQIDLTDAFGEDLHSITLALLLSTPTQLATALLKATGKWKDE